MSYRHADGTLRFSPPPFPNNKYRLRHGSESVLNLAINQSATLSAEFYYPPARFRLKRGDGFDPSHVCDVVHGHRFRYCYMHPAYVSVGGPGMPPESDQVAGDAQVNIFFPRKGLSF